VKRGEKRRPSFIEWSLFHLQLKAANKWKRKGPFEKMAKDWKIKDERKMRTLTSDTSSLSFSFRPSFILPPLSFTLGFAWPFFYILI
tara:strand:+ start:646 stop:906 length:261 start_codon:yes stop_codon:yes gene_type:complete